MRIKRFMDHKQHAGRSERTAIYRHAIDMSRDSSVQTTQQRRRVILDEGKRGRATDGYTLCEVNANSPLPISNVDEDIPATRANGGGGQVALVGDGGDKITSCAEEMLERPVAERRRTARDGDRSCHKLAGIDEDYFAGVVSDSEPQGADRDDIMMGACSSSCSSMSDCGMATTGPMTAAQTRRTLGQIRESLEQKVKRLRAEKAAVDEKIRLAREEEEIRTHERLKSLGKVVIQRKDRLRKLVGELQSQLEDQSERLQAAYNTLLVLQRTIFRSRSFYKSRRLKQRPGLAEAPF